LPAQLIFFFRCIDIESPSVHPLNLQAFESFAGVLRVDARPTFDKRAQSCHFMVAHSTFPHFNSDVIIVYVSPGPVVHVLNLNKFISMNML
jgi:hypothetical protein